MFYEVTLAAVLRTDCRGKPRSRGQVSGQVRGGDGWPGQGGSWESGKEWLPFESRASRIEHVVSDEAQSQDDFRIFGSPHRVVAKKRDLARVSTQNTSNWHYCRDLMRYRNLVISFIDPWQGRKSN